MLSSESFKKESRIKENCFVRNKKMPFNSLMTFILRGINRSLTVEIDQFLRELGGNCKYLTKQAVSKARMHIKHTSFIKINDTIVEEYYAEKHKTLKGYRLLAVDGSITELPYGKEIAKEFGKKNNHHESANCGVTITLHDVLNDIIVDSKLHRYGRNERDYLLEQLQQVRANGKQRKDIIIADRGYPSMEVFLKLKEMEYDFVIRYTGENFLREFTPFAKSRQNDTQVTIDLRSYLKRKKNKDLEKYLDAGINEITLRVVKIELNTGEIEYIITSILDSKKLTREDLSEIYRKRWGIEEGFKSLKNTIELENISGRVKETILQDYYSCIVIYNLHSLIIQEAQEELDKKVELKKNDLIYERYKINRHVSYGLFRGRITELFKQKDARWRKTYNELLKIIQRLVIPERPGRVYERKPKCAMKFHLNQRRVA